MDPTGKGPERRPGFRLTELEQRILRVVSERREGLSTGEIARAVDIHPQNVTKYLYRLVGAGLLRERRVGVAKLYYPTKSTVR